MSLEKAHEGYAYQDIITAYYILNYMLENIDSNFLIDKKEFINDKFDDLTIENEDKYVKFQIKFSNDVSNHSLEKKDLSTDGSYHLALDDLFYSWYNNPKKEILLLRLLLAWDKPSDELLDFLYIVNEGKSFIDFDTVTYKIDVNKFWPIEQLPRNTWKRFVKKSEQIKRDDFISFCDSFFIETNSPKASLNISSPGVLEKIILNKIDNLGIGYFPNAKYTKESFAYELIAKIRNLRSSNHKKILNIKEVYSFFQIVTNYGSIEQIFPIDENKNIVTNNYTTVIDGLKHGNKLLIQGEPGSGKSWFVNNLITELNRKKINTIKHYCYVDLQDDLQKERIKTNIFYGNIINEIINLYPKLQNKKINKFASTLSELNLLIQCIDKKTVIIIDGLDHIQRIFSYRDYTDISKDDINIIENINNIKTTKNVSIILVSQPSNELSNLNGYKTIEIPDWTIAATKELMHNLSLEDIQIENNILSELLLEKSSGNPLYLTYLIEELKLKSIINKELLISLPAYSINLSNYYDYILNKTNVCSEVPFALSAVNFNLTKEELKDITGLGKYVDSTLNEFKPILKQNTFSNGYIIYHESFRRYILEKLKDKEVRDEKIFNPILKWFESINFYSTPKANRFYFSFLADSNLYNKIEPFITKEFVSNCIYYGHPWHLIEKNYKYLVLAATKSQKIEKIILVNEINKTILGIKDSYEAIFLDYVESLCYKFGFEEISKSLIFEGKPSQDYKLGLKICYLLDSKGYVAPWSYYKNYFDKKDNIDLDEFKLLIRYLIVEKKKDELLKIANNIKIENLIEYKKIYIKEIHICHSYGFIINLIHEDQAIQDFINEHKNKYVEKINLYELAKEIIEIKNISEKEVKKIISFFDQINLQIEDEVLIKKIIKLFCSKNWFFNWLIYFIKIKQIKFSKKYNSIELREAFDCLIFDTEPFKGVPRACDLYNLKDFIYKSYEESLSLVEDIKDWEYIINILETVCIDTTTTFQRSENGPLITIDLFHLLIGSINENNSSIISRILENQFNQEKEYRFHSDIAEYCFQLVKAFHYCKNSEKKELYFDKGINFIIGYTWRRDLTIEDIIDSIDCFYHLDNKLGFQFLLKLKNLVDSIINHTDGKDTKHFPNEWYKKFLVIDNEKASIYLLNEMLKRRYDWQLEISLRDLLLNTNINPVLKSFLTQTLLIDTDEDFLLASFETIAKVQSDVVKNISLTSTSHKIEIAQKETLSPKLLYQCKKNLININPETEKELNPYSKFNNTNYISEIINKEIRCRKNFPDMTITELSDYLMNNFIPEKEIQSLFYLFNSFTLLNNEIKQIIKILIDKNIVNYNYNKIDLSLIFSFNNEISIYFFVALFVFERDGWYNSFSNINALKVAYKIDSTKTFEYLFELLPNKLTNGLNLLFSANLIKALKEINYDSIELKKSWILMYESIEKRIPVYQEYNWEISLSNTLNMSLNEIYICLFFARIKSYTVQKFHIVFSGITILLFQDSLQMIKPIKWILKNHKYYKNSIIVGILELLKIYSTVDDKYFLNFKDELMEIYPSFYFLIDHLIELFFDLPKFKKIINKVDICYPIEEDFANFFLSSNKRNYYLNELGFDMRNIFGKYRLNYQRINQDNIDIYYNKLHDTYVNNIFPSNYLLELINEDLYNELNGFYIPNTIYNYMKIDIKLIVSQYLSSTQRPIDLKKSSQYSEITDISNEFFEKDNWIRIAHYEQELVKQSDDTFKLFSIFGGIVFNEDNNFIFPYSNNSINSNTIWVTSNFEFIPDKTIVDSLIQNYFQLESYKILWLNPTLLNKLELQICDFKSGLCAKNIDNEIVLKFNSWFSDYIASTYFNGIKEEIPKLDGSELLIRNDYFKKICDIYKINPKYCVMKTF